MTGNHWTVFNSAGAVICDNMPLDVVRAYMTPERFERGWKAVYCLIVNSPEHLDELCCETLCGTFAELERKKPLKSTA